MSCHGKVLGDGAMLWICVTPLMGITSEGKWIEDELNLFTHNKLQTAALRKKLRYLRTMEHLDALKKEGSDG